MPFIRVARTFHPCLGRHVCLVVVAASIAVGHSTASAAETEEDVFSIGSHNVERGSTNPSEYPPFANIIGYQEVKDNGNGPVLAGLESTGMDYRLLRQTTGPEEQVPIAFNRARFSLVRIDGVDQDFYRKTHDGWICPNGTGASPHRYVHWAILESQRTHQSFAVINTHFVSGAWNGTWNCDDEKRQQMWEHHLRVLINVYQGLKAQGLPVLLVGDMNRHGKLTEHDDSIVDPTGLGGLCYVPLDGGDTAGIDQIYVSCDMDGRAGERLEKYGSDHFAVKARLTLKGGVE